MTLTEHIEEIRDNLRKNLFANEAAVKTGIVLKLLNALGWPTDKPQVVIPEHSVGGRWVDFALCHPASKPIAFIEVKHVGNIGGAERQLFEYAFHEGVPIAILTDGRGWRFFQPSGQGGYRERKVYEMDLLNDSLEDSVERLNRYLNYHAIQTGAAVQAIRDDYENVLRERQINSHLPQAWDSVTGGPNGWFNEVAEKTEELCGYKPTQEQILTFVKNLDGKTEIPPEESTSPPPQKPPATGKAATSPRASTTIVVTMPNGEKINTERGAAATAFVETIEKLGIERVKDIPTSFISTAKPSHSGHRQVGSYYISTYSKTIDKKRFLEKIAKELDEDLKVEIVPKA